MIFTKKTFTDCSQALPMAMIPLNFIEKTFTNILKTTKFAKVFALESFLLSREKTSADAANGCHAPKFHRENFHKQSQRRIVRVGGCPVVIAQWQSTGYTSQVSWVQFPAAASLFTFLYFAS